MILVKTNHPCLRVGRHKRGVDLVILKLSLSWTPIQSTLYNLVCVGLIYEVEFELDSYSIR
jgi:hypothetical protein